MRRENPGHTLQATALVGEAYLRMCKDAGLEPGPAQTEPPQPEQAEAAPRTGAPPAWQNRAHFFFAAARAMQQILIEHARSKSRLKRGGDRRQIALSIVDLAEEADEEQILALDAAICRLEGRDERAAQIVRLRFFAGLDVEDTAAALGLSERTVKREWAFARAWLFEELEGTS